MSLLEKIIYLADKNKDNRNYLGINIRRNLALKSIDDVMILILKNNIHFMIQKYNNININSLKTLHFLQEK